MLFTVIAVGSVLLTGWTAIAFWTALMAGNLVQAAVMLAMVGVSVWSCISSFGAALLIAMAKFADSKYGKALKEFADAQEVASAV